MENGKHVEIPAGHMGVVPVRVIPKTSIALSAAATTVSALKTTITLKGSVENLPNGTPVAFSWIVQRGTETVAFPVPGLKLKVENKTQGSIAAPLDVIEHRLIGTGSVGFEISPDFPYCPTQRVAPGPIKFDNPLSIKFLGDVSNERIGSIITVRPTIGSVFQNAIVQATFRERDEGEGEVATAEDMAHKIAWSKGETGDKRWRIGCTEPEGAVVFDYLESGESGGYEIDYTLSVSSDDGKTFTTVHESGQVLTVPRPTLESFELYCVQSSLWQSDTWDYLKKLYQNWNEEEAKQVPLNIWRAKGKLTGFDPDLPLSVEVSLWLTDTEGKTYQFKETGATAGLEHTVTLGEDGSFDEKLCDVCDLDHETDWSKFKTCTFFAVLRLPAAVTGTEERRPIAQVFDFDIAKLAPFLDGERSSLLRATGVATAGAPAGELRPTCTGDLATLYTKHEDLCAKLKIELGTKSADMEKFTKLWKENKTRYDKVAKLTDLPAALIAALHWRESGGKFDRYLHQGDPLGKPAVHVPTNIPVFHVWEDAAVHALGLNRNVAVNLAMTYVSKDLAKMATYAERYNGLGYHKNGRISPYVYSGTTHYKSGKYIKDGVYSDTTVDAQIGVIPLVDSAMNS